MSKPDTSLPPGFAGAPVYVLAGGESRRFGSDKAFADEGGIPRTVAISRLWEPRSAAPPTAVGRKPGAFEAWGLRTIVDPPGLAGQGPAAGLLAALLDRRERHGPGWLLLVACDTVQVEPALADRLPQPTTSLAPPASPPPGAVLASVFRDRAAPQRFQPFPGRWHTACADVVRERLERGARSMQGLLTELPTAEVPTPPGLAVAAASGNRPT